MAKDKEITSFSAALLHPRYWLTWLLFGLWWLAAQLPFAVQLALSRVVGFFSFRFAKRRKAIAARNLALCFPELDEAERQRLLRENFDATAMAIFETGISWFGSKKRVMSMVEAKSMDIVQAFADKNQGFVFLVLHFTPLELLGAFMNYSLPRIDVSYRPHRNAVYDYVQARQRRRHNATAGVIPRGDVRGMVRSLKSGHSMAYLPDQDYGRKYSVFASFFGIPTATVVGLSRIAALAKVPVVPLFCFRKSDNSGYYTEVFPPLENFPSDDPVRDATVVNAHVEACVRRCPEQYLWVHRRFKTRPEGEQDLYQLPKKNKRKR